MELSEIKKYLTCKLIEIKEKNHNMLYKKDTTATKDEIWENLFNFKNKFKK